MNNTFEATRFWNLTPKTISERPTQIFGLILLDIVVVFALYSLLRSFIGWNGTQNLTFIWGFIFGGCYLATTMYNYFSSASNGSSYLTLPASTFEKWLTVILITWVLYSVIFLSFFYLMDFSYVSIYQSQLNPRLANFQALRDSVQPFDLTGNVARKTYMMFLALTSVMFVGALYFNRISFIKTSLLICLVLAGVYGLNLMIAHILFDNVSDAFPFSHVAFDLKRGESAVASVSESFRPMFDEASIELPWSSSPVFNFCKNYFLPIILALTAYLRLREKEF